jgi:hypothetical protein
MRLHLLLVVRNLLLQMRDHLGDRQVRAYPSSFLRRKSEIWPAGYQEGRAPVHMGDAEILLSDVKRLCVVQNTLYATLSLSVSPKISMGDAESFCAAHRGLFPVQAALCRPKSFCVAHKLSMSPKTSLCRPKRF